MPFLILFILFSVNSSFLYAANPVYPPSEVEMELKQVSPHVFYTQGKAGIATDNEGFISNAAVIITKEGIILVDALGSPSLAQLLLQKIREISDQPILKVFATHYHADHIYGLQFFKELGAEIIAPAGFQDYLDSPLAEERLEERRFSLEPWVNDQTRLIQPDRVIEKNESFVFGGLVIDITYLGAAHSDGDLMVAVTNDRVLISGDLIFEGRIPFTGGANTRNWLEALENLDSSGLIALIPGHGPAATRPAETLSLTLNYLKKVRQVMAIAVDDMESFAEAFEAADWSEFERLPAYDAAHRVNAYGIYLSLEQETME